MTTMYMPPNTVRLIEKSPGTYAGTGTFTMSGSWVVSATGKVNGKYEPIGSFLVNVVD